MFYIVFRFGSEVTQQKQLKDDANAVMQQMMTYVHYTAVSIYRFPVVNIYSLFSLVLITVLCQQLPNHQFLYELQQIGVSSYLKYCLGLNIL